ncbi:LOW QUALITY PROTEIN: protein SSUH2 homolog [Morus bassanus]
MAEGDGLPSTRDVAGDHINYAFANYMFLLIFFLLYIFVCTYISEEEAKDAFIQFAASKCCYRTAPPKHVVVQSLTALNMYRYQLQTFTKSRSVLAASEPCRGVSVDSPEMAVPMPWDVAVDSPPLFADEMHLPEPHTYRGWVPCAQWVKGLLLCRLELTITWGKRAAEYVDKNQGFPPSCFQVSEQLFSDEHHLKHAVELTPLARTEYEWKGKAYSFYVFGNEKQFYAEDYLGKCCAIL